MEGEEEGEGLDVGEFIAIVVYYVNPARGKVRGYGYGKGNLFSTMI